MSFIDNGDAQPAAGAPLDITPTAAPTAPTGNFANVPLPRLSPLDTPIDYGDAQVADSALAVAAPPQIDYGTAQPYTPPPGDVMFAKPPAAQPNTPPPATPLAPTVKSGPAGPAPQGALGIPIPTDFGKIAQAAGKGFDEGTGGPPMGAPGTPLGDALQKLGVIVPGSAMAPFNSMLAQTIGGIYSLPLQAVPGAINAAAEAIREAAYQAAVNAGADKDKASSIADDLGGSVEMEVARQMGNAGAAHAPEAVNKPPTTTTPAEVTVDHYAGEKPQEPTPAAPVKSVAPTSDADAQAAIEGRKPEETTPEEAAKSAPETMDGYLSLFKTLEGSGEHAVSPAGAIGTWQIMPGTARQYGYDPTRLSDPLYNRAVATAILADLSRRYSGDVDAMAVAYNAGPGVADKWIKAGRDNAVLPAETQRYLAHAQSLGGGEAGSVFDLPPSGSAAKEPQPVPMPDLTVPAKELINDSNAHAEPGVDPVEVKEAPLETVKSALAPKDVQESLNQPVTIDRSQNVKEGAGSSADGKTIFLDKNMPKEITFKAVDGVEPKLSSFDPAQSILVHERVEKALLDSTNPKTGENYSYDEAHPIALAAEHAWIRENVGSPGFVAQYEEQLKGWIKHDEGEADKDFAPVDPRQSGNPKESALKEAPAAETAVSGALSKEAAPEEATPPPEKKKTAKRKDVSRETSKSEADEGDAVPEDGHAKDADAKGTDNTSNDQSRSAQHAEGAGAAQAVEGKDAGDEAAGNREAEAGQGSNVKGAEIGVRKQAEPAGLAKPSDGEGRSKIGKSIEAKAVEDKLTASFKDTAGYDPITIKDQAKRATDLIRDDVDKARAVVRGEEPLPEGLRGTALITAMEEHIKTARDGDLAYELANSPLVSMTSAAAQEMRLAAERSPDSAAAKLQEIRDALMRRAGGEKTVAKKKRIILDRLKASTEKVNLSKEDLSWNRFLDSIGDTTLGQTATRGEKAPTFYSAAVRAVENAKIVKGTPDQWLATIKNTPGVKQEELDWMGLGDWLKAQTGAVTRDQVADFVRANQIEVKDVEKGGDLSHADVRKSQGISASAWDDMSESERRDAYDAAVKDTGATKFAQYQLAGGENYRELLLTLPPTKNVLEQWKVIRKDGHVDGTYASKQQAQLRAGIISGRVEQAETLNLDGGFRSSHFNEPNILAHVRMNDRTDADGRKTLFLEEVQSDWHQAGRKKGYASNEPATQYTVRRNADGSRSILDQDGRTVVERTFHNNLNDQQLIADRIGNVPGVFKPRAGVPDAPFKTTWPELALKRMIRYASENGYDQLAWTPGDIQAERYDLSKQIAKVEYSKSGASGSTPIDEIEKADGGVLRAYGHDGQTVIDQRVNEKELADYVGKDVAEKLVGQPGTRIKEDGTAKVTRSLSGLDLKVGGEGMKGFYDRILPNAANKLGKKFGAKVGETTLDSSSRDAPASWESVETSTARPGARDQVVHALPITDAMRESVTQEGQPLFQRTPSGVAPNVKVPPEAQERLIRGMQAKVERLIGDHAEVSFEPNIPVHDGVGDAEYQAGMDAFSKAGGTVTGETAGGVARIHSTGEALIRLAYDDPKFEAIGSARHEALHIAHALLMDDAENAALHEPENVAKLTQWAAKELGMDPNGTAIAALPMYEKLAIGFEHFDRLRDEGKPLASIRGVPAFAMRFWEKLRHLSAEIKRMLTGHGFKRVNDIFEELSSGKMAERGALTEPRKITDPFASELAQTTRDQTKMPAFKKWFGDSKVVDEKGEPLVVYHGAPDARFMKDDATFKTIGERYGKTEPEKRAFWFTPNRSTAASYADDRRAFDYQNAEPNTIPAYLKLENPLEIDARGKEWREAQARGKTSDVIEQARAAGHDGVVIRNVMDDYNNSPRTKPTDTYAVFSSTQIKSAIGNSGAFDPSNPSILGQTATRAKSKEPTLSPDKIADFRKALKDKDIKIADLLNMSTEDRTALLRKYTTNDADAKALNTQFEQKLVLKNRMQGIKNWAAKLGEVGKYSNAGKAAAKQALDDYKSAQSERVFSPKQNESFLNDLADKTLGTHVSRDIAQKVFDLSAKADALKNVNPKLSGVSDEYLSARNELHDFVASHKNTSVVKSMGRSVVTIARNNLLANPSTPIKTAIGQTVNSAMDMFTRRVGARAAYGLNRELVRQANGEAWETFRKTGLNTASMERIDDDGKLGERQNFANPAGASTPHPIVGAAEATLRNAARLSNKIVIDWEHNYAFTKFYQKAFFDMTNITSSGIAKSEGLSGAAARSRAGAIFKDAARIEPETREGAMVRLEAQKQAARITSTNPTMVSRLSLGAKNWLNSVTPDFPLGDILIPIAKIPANIIANGIDNAGVGLFSGVRDIFQGRAKIQSDDLQTRYEGMAQFAGGIQRVTRVLGVITAAAFFTSQLRKEDFRGDPWGNHFVKIGNIWINMEYINAVSPALAGMMEVKQKGRPHQGVVDTAGQYTSGALQGLKSVPGIDEAEKLVTAITNSNYTKGIMKYGKDLFTSRGEPAFIKALLSDRPIERLFFGATGVETDDQLRQDKVRRAQNAAASRAANNRVSLP